MEKLGLTFMAKEYPFLTREEISTVLSMVNQDEIYSNCRASYTYSIWDDTSPISGISPDKIKEDAPTAAGRKIYFIYENNYLIIIQKANPFSSGNLAMTENDIDLIANQYIDILTDNKARSQVIKAIEAEIDKLLI